MKNKFLIPFIYLIFCVSLNASQIVSDCGEKYDVIELISENDMSSVYLAKNSKGEEVAIKRYFDQTELSENHDVKALSSFVDNVYSENMFILAKYEYLISKKLKSASVVNVHTYFMGTDNISNNNDSHAYLVMDYHDTHTISYYEYYGISITKNKALKDIINLFETLKFALHSDLYYTQVCPCCLTLDENHDLKFVDLSYFVPLEENCSLTNREYIEKMLNVSYTLLNLTSAVPSQEFYKDLDVVLDPAQENANQRLDWLNSPVSKSTSKQLIKLMDDLRCYLITLVIMS